MTERPLQREIETYNANLPELLGSIGRFVLVKGDRIEGIYDTYADAVKAGYGQFKLEPLWLSKSCLLNRSLFYARLSFECPP
jgi:hypothetical protein